MENDLDFNEIVSTNEGRNMVVEAVKEVASREWESTTDPMDFVTRFKTTISDRKSRLIACMISRQRWYSMSEDGKDCIKIAEIFVDAQTPLSLNLVNARTTCRRNILLAHDMPKSEENDDYIRLNGLARHTCKITAVIPFLQRSIERARKCGIEDNVMCEIIRDIVGNPFVEQPRVGKIINLLQIDNLFLRNTNITKIANSIYSNHQNNGQIDSSELFMLAGYLQDNGCENHQILSNLTKECPYCKDLGKNQGSQAECGEDHRRMEQRIQSSGSRECVCKGTRLARHWKGNWIVDLLMGK